MCSVCVCVCVCVCVFHFQIFVCTKISHCSTALDVSIYFITVSLLVMKHTSSVAEASGGSRGAQWASAPPLPSVSLPSSRNDLLALLNLNVLKCFFHRSIPNSAQNFKTLSKKSILQSESSPKLHDATIRGCGVSILAPPFLKSCVCPWKLG